MQSDGLARLSGMIGLARRAGKTVIGTEQVCLALAKTKSEVKLVLFSHTASDATKKKITVKCEFYGVKAIEINIDTEELARLLGKSFATAAVAVTDDNLAVAIEKRAAEANNSRPSV